MGCATQIWDSNCIVLILFCEISKVFHSYFLGHTVQVKHLYILSLKFFYNPEFHMIHCVSK